MLRAGVRLLLSALGVCAIRLADVDDQGSKRVAILMAGTADRVLVTPPLINLIRANALAGVNVDYYFSLKAPRDKTESGYAAMRNESKWLKAETTDRYTMDPNARRFFHTADAREAAVQSTQSLAKFICEYARSVLATNCEWELESEEPLVLPDDESHLRAISYYNPLTTSAGKSVLAKWRSLGSLWGRAKASEKVKGAYNSVLVVRDDDFWIAPYYFQLADFKDDPALLKVIPCLESHGINDKAVHMGRVAADVLLGSYETWKAPLGDHLQSSRNAEEFWYKTALANGLTIKPESMPMAVAAYTQSGIPCFRKQTFNISAKGGYEQCYGETDKQHPLTNLFHAFNCEDMNPSFFDLLKQDSVNDIQSAMSQLTHGEEGGIILTLIDADQADLAAHMLRSLHASGERNGCLIVGTAAGACEALDAITKAEKTHPYMCALVPHEDSRAVLKHATLTTVALTGLASSILYAEPNVVFLRAPMAYFDAKHPDEAVVFTMNNALKEGAAQCEDVAEKYAAKPGARAARRRLSTDAGATFDLDNGMFFMRQSTVMSELLMRTWMNLVTNSDKTHRWALAMAVEDSPWIGFGKAPCNHFANGNVFWGHRELLKSEDVIAVHANWVEDSVKRDCMAKAGIWMSSSSQSFVWRSSSSRADNVEMGAAGQVLKC